MKLAGRLGKNHLGTAYSVALGMTKCRTSQAKAEVLLDRKSMLERVSCRAACCWAGRGSVMLGAHQAHRQANKAALPTITSSMPGRHIHKTSGKTVMGCMLEQLSNANLPPSRNLHPITPHTQTRLVWMMFRPALNAGAAAMARLSRIGRMK
jgi:hypothetical protein